MAQPALDLESAQRHSMAPNVFYDLIVFLTPTMTFLIGVGIGAHQWLILQFSGTAFSVDTTVLILLGLALFFGSYEFGRIAETYSDIFVAGPIRFLHRRRLLFTSRDYGVDLSDQVGMIGIPEALFFGRAKSKWTLFFFALEFIPHVGADLLKRYAWEKLARSSAFAILCLFGISIFTWIYYSRQGWQIFPGNFGSLEYTIAAFSLYVLWSVDYYKRNCWNNDLLITTMPVIISSIRTPPAQDAPGPSSPLPPATRAAKKPA